MPKVIHKLLTIIAVSIPLLSSAYAFAEEADPSVTYSTPLLPNVTDYTVDTGNDVTLDVNVAEINALEITLSTSNLLIDLTPKVTESSFGSDTLNILVGTSNSTGYTLTMQPFCNNTATASLTRTEAIDNTLPTIDTINAATTPATFASTSDTATMNKWGYLLSTTNLNIDKTIYNPVLATNTINSSTEAISNDPSTIVFAAKADSELPAGNYRATLKFIAVANPTAKDFSAAYKSANKSSVTYNNNEYYAMQDMDSNICTIVDIGETGVLIDTRDNTTYAVGKAKDDNCWMVQDLKLGMKASSYTLNNATSNIGSSSFNLNGKLSNAAFTASGSWTNNSSQFYCNSYDCYYNWYAATAGSGSSSTTSGNASYSICPRGWILPTGGANGQLAVLSANYDNQVLVNDFSSMRENESGEIPGFLLNGYASNSSAVLGVGTAAMYWSRTTKSGNEAYKMDLTSDSVSNGNGRGKYGGNALRCLAQ